MPSQFNHVAYACRDAAETTKFYTEVIGLRFTQIYVNDYVPSTKEYCPHCHVFFELPDGSSIAFFEAPLLGDIQRDPRTSSWIEHVAMEVDSVEDFERHRKRLDDHGIEYLGPMIHKEGQRSVYFFDPNGLRLEFIYPVAETAERNPRDALEAWVKRKEKTADWHKLAATA